MIKKIYFGIWTDCIKQIKSVPRSKDGWKFYSLTVMSLLMGINWMFLSMFILSSSWGKEFEYSVDIGIFGKTIGILLEGFILFMLPMLVLNYLLVFRNDRYLTFIDKYDFQNGKWFRKYLLLSLWLPVVALCLGLLYVNLLM